MPPGVAPLAAPASSSRLFLKPPNSFVAPTVLAATTAFRYKDAFLKRFTKTCTATNPLATHTVVACSSKGISFPHSSATSFPLLSEGQSGLSYTIPTLPTQRKSICSVKASKDNPFSYRIPSITEKPQWWWRTLACVPYLITLQMSSPMNYLYRFFEHYGCHEDLVGYIPGAIKSLPWWFPTAYFCIAYFCLARNKEWPHFFRFHLVMGMLLETAIQVVWISSNFMPLIHYEGTYGIYYWAVVGFMYILAFLECVRSALAGKYVKLPVLSDSAFVHTLFNIGGFQRPF